MKELVYLRVETIDSTIGNDIKFLTEDQLDVVKKLPDVYKSSDCVPNLIEVRRFIFSYLYDAPIELIIKEALNRGTEKFPKIILKWTKATGWVET